MTSRSAAADATSATSGWAIGRRHFLGISGAGLAGAGLFLIGCGSDDSSTASPSTGPAATGTATTASPSTGTAATEGSTGSTSGPGAVADLTRGTPATTVFTAADFSALGTCTLLPDLTQGPFPTIDQIERRDITEGLGGHPLRVGVRVVDASCAPVAGAKVEIWHCDVDGDYSAYTDGYTTDDAGPGTTFFRGSQTANSDGIVEFLTSYPGWYSGRAVHIHAKVHLDAATVLTTQFFFADELNEKIFTEDAYAAHGDPDTTNATDSVSGGTAEEEGLLMTVSDDAQIFGSRGLIVVGIDPTATSAGAAGGGFGGGQGGGQGGGGAPPAGGGSPPGGGGEGGFPGGPPSTTN